MEQPKHPREKRADRWNVGKPELHYVLCFPDALRGVARVSTLGTEKYSAYNFMRGASVSESIDSMLRHLLSFWGGEDVDPETGLPHLDHAAWNALRLADEHARKTSVDDRPHKILEDAGE